MSIQRVSTSSAKPTPTSAPCSSKHNCRTCEVYDNELSFQGSYNKEKHNIITLKNTISISCNTGNIIYLITCNNCKIQYVGETKRSLRARIGEHLRSIKNPNKANCKFFAEHYNQNPLCTSFKVQIIEQMEKNASDKLNKEELLKQEKYWIKKLRTLAPYGLNDKFNNQNYNGSIFKNLTNDKPMNNKTNNITKRNRKPRSAKRNNFDMTYFLKTIEDEHTTNPTLFRSNIIHKIIGLNKQNLKNLSLITLDHDDNHQVHGIIKDLCLHKMNIIFKRSNIEYKKSEKPKILVRFNNTLMNYLNISNIIKQSSVKQEWPSFKSNTIQTSTPMLIFKYNAPIGTKIFNYRQSIENIDITNHTNSNHKCECENSPYMDIHHKHILTGNLDIIENIRLRELLRKGPKFRTPMKHNIDIILEDLLDALLNYTEKIALNNKLNNDVFNNWINKIITLTQEKYNEIKNNIHFTYNKFLNINYFKKDLEELKKKFVFTRVDKASQNFAIICKKFYIQQLLIEVNTNNYETITLNKNTVITNLVLDSSNLKIPVDTKFHNLPYIQLIPKFHKAITKFRIIIASCNAATKPLSITLSKILKLIQIKMKNYSNAIQNCTKLNFYWIIDNHHDILNEIYNLKDKGKLKSINTYDFTTLYTSLVHEEIFTAMEHLYDIAFHKNDNLYINTQSNLGHWTRNLHSNSYNRKNTIAMTKWLINNTYFQLGNQLYRQIIGIPMGTNAGSFLANLFLHYHELKFGRDNMNKDYKKCFNLRKTFRYIDDITVLNDNNTFDNNISNIYPKSLNLEKVNQCSSEANVLDLDIKISNNPTIEIFDKRRHFPFNVLIFPHYNSNISQNCLTMTLINEIIRISSVCSDLNLLIKNLQILINNIKHRNYSCRIIRKCLSKVFSPHSKNSSKFKIINFKNNILNKLTF